MIRNGIFRDWLDAIHFWIVCAICGATLGIVVASL